MLTPVKAIRAKCLDCMGGHTKEVRMCDSVDCPLYPFRLGKNPNMQANRTPAQLEALEKGRLSQKPPDNSSAF